jgi:carbon monoxide dehydrogenase subunit G
MSTHVIEHSIDIARPPAKVFEYVSNFANDTQWRSGVKVMSQNPPFTKLNTETHEIMRFMGSDYDTRAKVTEYVSNEKVTSKSTQGQVEFLGWRAVEPIEGGTRLTMHTELGLSGGLATFAPLLVWRFSRRMSGDLNRVRAILETKEETYLS